MKRSILSSVTALAILTGMCAWAREDARGGRERCLGEGDAMRMGEEGAQGAVIVRMLAHPSVLTAAGISEAQAGKLKADLKVIETKMIALREETKKAALEQTEQMAQWLSDPSASSKNLMERVELLGALRTEKARLRIQRLIAIRENLTPDQIARVRSVARERLERERDARKRRNEGDAPAARREHGRGFRGRDGGGE